MANRLEDQSFLVDDGRVICLQLQVERFRLQRLHFHFGAGLNKHFAGLATDLASHSIFEAELHQVEVGVTDISECEQPVEPVSQIWNLVDGAVGVRSKKSSEQPSECIGQVKRCFNFLALENISHINFEANKRSKC